MALGESSGTVTVAITPDGVSSTVLAVEASALFPEKTTLPLHTLDELLESGLLTPPDLVKMDVQGSEDRILRRPPRLELCPGVADRMLALSWRADIVEMLDDLGFIAVESSDSYYSEGHQLCTLDLYLVRRELAKSLALSGQQGSWVDGRA